MASILGKPHLPNTNGWRDRHAMAVNHPATDKGEAIAVMLAAWALYEKGYAAMYPETMLADDYVLGAAWKDAGIAMRQLLNGVCGRLDCGTLDGFICDTLREAGFADEAFQ
jgi:hypothetical protein